MGELDGKVAIVTGAGRYRSIGRACALELARAGADIVITGTGRPPETFPEDEKAIGWRDIDSVAEEIRQLNRRALPLAVDISNREQVQQMVQRTLQEFGRIDILVNNASFARGRDRVPVLELDDELWYRIIDVNLNGTYLCCKAVAKEMVKQGRGGRIINISSVAGKTQPPNASAYAASKAAVQSLTGSLSGELAPYGITVNCICPGIVDTSRMDDLGRGERWQQVVARVPLGRAGTGADVAHMVVFLCSDKASWITGQSINVDGGLVKH